MEKWIKQESWGASVQIISKCGVQSQAWQHKPVTPVFGRLVKDCFEFGSSQDYLVKVCLKKQTIKGMKQKGSIVTPEINNFTHSTAYLGFPQHSQLFPNPAQTGGGTAPGPGHLIASAFFLHLHLQISQCSRTMCPKPLGERFPGSEHSLNCYGNS